MISAPSIGAAPTPISAHPVVEAIMEHVAAAIDDNRKQRKD